MFKDRMYKIMMISVKISGKLMAGPPRLFTACENKNGLKDCLFDKKYIFAPVTKTFYNVRHRYKS